MPPHKTYILRHRKENLRKCSLTGLEDRVGLEFYTYPKDPFPELTGSIMLTLGAPPLSSQERNLPLLLIDGTWRHAEVMTAQVKKGAPNLVERSIPSGWRTAYPRRQTECSDPEAGLASIEALWIAHALLGLPLDGLLDRYYWKDRFFQLNSSKISDIMPLVKTQKA